MSELKSSVDVVGAPWIDSPYYDDAEQWVHIFWNPGTAFRRHFDQLDLVSVLELACGHGRHAVQVALRCEQLALMDIHEGNLSYCRNRLRNLSNIHYYQNNGYDYRPIADATISAIYCYDSMVHFSPDIVSSYLIDTRRVLRPGGLAIYHHSNYAAPPDKHYGQNPHARNHMTEGLFRQLTEQARLEVVETVAIDWGNVQKLDRISLLRAPF